MTELIYTNLKQERWVFEAFWCSLRIMAGIHWVIDSFDTVVSTWMAGALSEYEVIS